MEPAPEPYAEIDAYSLSELNSAIKETIETTFPETVWVVAEISECRAHKKGHCYLELVEKRGEMLVAQIKANIWAYTYRSLSQKFEKATEETLKAGMQVLLSVDVTFHEVYGLSLNIKDIDPTYSLGEMARKKRETIEKLKKEGLIDLNKQLPLPLVPQRIAVISSSSAAGYGDFVNHLERNPYGYKVHHTLYQAIMQGAETEESILVALELIRDRAGDYDAIAVIRGGGSKIDLSCFDSYRLAAEVAGFCLPVITGIGHERDDTVVDLVAHTRLKTPTAVAEFLISGMREFEERLLEGQRRLTRLAGEMIREEGHRLRYLAQHISHQSTKRFHDEHRRLHMTIHNLRLGSGNVIHDNMKRLSLGITRLGACTKSYLQEQGSRLQAMGQALRLLDPVNILKRGYSITYFRGKAVTDAKVVKEGDIIITKLYDGSIKSTVEEKNGQ